MRCDIGDDVCRHHRGAQKHKDGLMNMGAKAYAKGARG